MAAYAAVVSLMNNIEQIMAHPHLSTSLDNNHIQPLVEKAGLLLDFIEGYNYTGVISKEVDDLEKRIACAAHAAEDVIESHIVDQILAGSSFLLSVRTKIRGMKKKVGVLKRRIASTAHAAEDGGSNRASLSCWLQLQQIVEDMDGILRKAIEIKEKEGLRLRLREEQPPHSRPSQHDMVGFQDELIQIMDELTNQRSSRHIISIVGMGGMGKTTLAQNLYTNPLINQHFDIRVWATVSQQYSVQKILSQLLSGQEKSSDRTVDELGEELYKALSGRRYLIILDDIWSVEAWDEVRHFFPDNGSRSRVLLTTRLSNVAIECGSSCFTKKILDENESWKLFCEKAFRHENCPYPELEEVGKKIVQLCKGLPLSIVVIGGSLLKSPRTIGYWEDVANDIRSVPNSKEKQESLDVLFSSYNHLPAHLKPCFLYIGFFRSFTYYKMDVSEIIKLWVAEGFLKSDGAQVLEEMAEDYLKDLVDRSLILVGRRSKKGKMKYCEIHDLLRDLCLKVAEEQEFYHVTEGIPQGTERRLIYTSAASMKGAAGLARSVMVDEFCSKPELDKHRLLRVLDERNRKSVEKPFRFVNLRHLAIQQPDGRRTIPMWKLPTSIYFVWNLQTLIIKDTLSFESVAVAPSEIWKMQQLRHVKCPEIYLPHPSLSEGQDDLFIVENLQTLKNAVI